MAESNTTKSIFAATIKDLMLKDHFSKISIGEICDACDMNRKSFYYHFRDKYDLINWIFQTGFVESVITRDYHRGWDFVKDILQYVYDERTFYAHAFTIEGQNAFSEYFAEVLTPFLVVFSDGIFDKTDNPKFYQKLACNAFISLVITWISEKHPDSPKVFTDNLATIFSGLYNTFSDKAN